MSYHSIKPLALVNGNQALWHHKLS